MASLADHFDSQLDGCEVGDVIELKTRPHTLRGVYGGRRKNGSLVLFLYQADGKLAMCEFSQPLAGKCNEIAHDHREEVAQLVKHLKCWLETGSLEIREEG